MKKQTRTALILVLLLVAGAGIGFAALNESYTATSGTTYDAGPDGPEITYDDDLHLLAEQPFPDGNTIDLHPHGTISSQGETSMRISDPSHTYVELRQIQTNANTIDADMEDQTRLQIQGNVDRVEWRNIDPLDDDGVDISHDGDMTVTVHVAVSDESDTPGMVALDADTGEVLDWSDRSNDPTFELQGSNDVTVTTASGPEIENASPDGDTVSSTQTELSADVASEVNGDVEVDITHDGTVVHSTTVTGSGTVSTTVDTTDLGEQDWGIDARDVETDTSTTREYQFNVASDGAPEIDRDSVEPDTAETISDIPFPMAGDVSDPDGTDVDVEFIVEDATVGSDTVSGDGRAEITHDENIAGAYDWRIEATDEFGQTTVEDGFTFYIPSELEVRDELTGDLIDGDTSEVEIQFFPADGEDVITRTTNDGVVDLSGLPADQRMIIRGDAVDYEPRRVMLDSLVDQQQIYLLDDSADSVTNEFTIEDRTDQFRESSTMIRIEKPISTEDGDRYQTIAGDEIGASGTFTSTLQADQRYRISVENAEGAERSLGSYVADTAGPVPLRIGTVELQPDSDLGYRFSAESTGDEDNPEATITFVDQAGLTDQLTYEIYRQGDSSEPVYGPVEVSDPQDYRDTVPLNESGTYVVEWELDRDGETTTGETTIGGLTDLDWPLPGDVLQSLGLFTLIGVAVLFGGSMSTTGAVVVSVLAFALTMIGALAIPYPFLAMAGVISVLFKVGDLGGVR